MSKPRAAGVSDAIARYFYMDQSLVEHLPSIFADFAELGSDPDWIAEQLREQGLSQEDRVLDLGCGKGAVAVAIAKQIGARVDGVDLVPGFIRAADALARRNGVEQLCRFRQGDLADVVVDARGYDAVLLVSVGSVFGSWDESVAELRHTIRPGGLMVIDDAFGRTPVDFPGYEGLVPYSELLRQFRRHGDEVVSGRLFTIEEMKEQNERYNQWLNTRCSQLSVIHPEHARHLEDFLKAEREASALLENEIRCGTWVLRRPVTPPIALADLPD